jgi:ribosomal protein S12 methylthiotransferase accessory factor
MSVGVAKSHRAGTHRAVAPEATLARVRAHLDTVGVTRCADITGLDRIGLPVRCAVRPRGRILQTSAGKGLRDVDAQVSALMEALEHWHAEQPPHAAAFGSAAEVATPDRPVVAGAALTTRRRDLTGDDATRREWWVPARSAADARGAWVPASAVYADVVPVSHRFTATGLASGNVRVEAELHALYEVLERDVVTRALTGDRVRLDAAPFRRIALDTITDPAVDGVVAAVRRAGCRLALLTVDAPPPVTVCWAALLDPTPFHPCTRVNLGYGAHLDPGVAATRAVTEAAQSRLSYIHGAREDLAHKIRAARADVVGPVFQAFDSLPARAAWTELVDAAGDTLHDDHARVLGVLGAAGYGDVWVVDLDDPAVGIPVVRVLVPGAVADRRFF